MKKSNKYLLIPVLVLISFFSVSAQDKLMNFTSSTKAEEIITKLQEKYLFPAKEREVTIVGGVPSSGIIRPVSPLPLTHAIAMTGGLLKKSDRVIRILRKDEKGVYSIELFVDIEKVKKGEIKDVSLVSGDIVIVAGDPKKEIALRNNQLISMGKIISNIVY